MTKRFVSLFLVLVMLLIPSPFVYADEVQTSGTINGIQWSYDKTTKTLSFSGKGEITNYDKTWNSFRQTYIKEVEYLVIGEGITKIDEYCHIYLNNDLNPKVSLPLTLTYIDKYFLYTTYNVTVYYAGTPAMWEKIENHNISDRWTIVYGMEKTADLNEFFNPISIKGSFDNFKEINEYKNGQFVDVKENDWFSSFVEATYRRGLFAGTSATTFNPQGNLSNAEAIVLAVALRRTYADDHSSLGTGSPWYKPYVSYAVSNGIVGSAYASYDNNKMNSPISRLDFARIFVKALPKETYVQLSEIKERQIPDMCNDSANPIIPLYNAGIISGKDAYGTFDPTSSIKRCEVAVIVSNMADQAARKPVTLQPKPNTPDAMIQGVWRYRNSANNSAMDEYSFLNGTYSRASSEGKRFIETGTYRIDGNKIILAGERITGDSGGFVNQTTSIEGYELLINNISSGGMSATYSYNTTSNSKWFMKAGSNYLIDPYSGAVNSTFNLYSDNLKINDLSGYVNQDLKYLYGSLVDKTSFKLLGCFAGVAATTLANDSVVTVIVYSAKTVLGVQKTESYVCYHDLYTGQDIHNAVKYYEDQANSDAGMSKLKKMSAQNQAMSFAANTSKMGMIPTSSLASVGSLITTSKWKIDAYFNSSLDSTTRLSSISRTAPVFCHFTLSGGKKGESITVHNEIIFPDGEYDTQEDLRNYRMTSGQSAYVYWDNGIYLNPSTGKTGTMIAYFFDENGVLIGTASVSITE